ncbi:MAG: Zn-ribbon domain-containing OB-fold protein [Deltaproteobacteria bacterium]|nr:Zn-ribbon domain-containing OB-fold protein [Deltaproteobacteria bacterium]
MAKEIELISVEDKWEIPYSYSAGETVSKFLVELRDNERLMGTKCPKCNQVILPPRSFCATCFISLKDHWVEVEPEGKLVTYSIATEKITGAPEPPYVVAFVTLGESKTVMAQFLEGLDLSDLERVKKRLKSGMPVKAVFKDRAERKAHITDFHIELK